jgi:phage terminase Nu1 subunit (DNA packaging protein)
MEEVTMTYVADDAIAPEQVDYSTEEVAALSGLTYRIVDYWCRQGAISPRVEASGSGSRRRFSPDQAEWLLRIGEAYRQAERRGLDLTTLAVSAIWRSLEAGEDWEINLWVGPTP